MTKQCEACGQPYARKRGRGSREWARQRFCSHACRYVALKPPPNHSGRRQPNRATPARERIMRHSFPIPPRHPRWPGCWLWTSQVDKEGRPRIKAKRRKSHSAARFAYRAFVGTVPNGLVLDHLCANRRCVNPWHLEPVTAAENSRRGTHGRPKAKPTVRTHCFNGHEFTDDNTKLELRRGKPARRCRICLRASKRKGRGRVAALPPPVPAEIGRAHV